MLCSRQLQILHFNILSHLPSHLAHFSKVPEVHKKALPKEKVPVPVSKKMVAPPAKGISVVFSCCKKMLSWCIPSLTYMPLLVVVLWIQHISPVSISSTLNMFCLFVCNDICELCCLDEIYMLCYLYVISSFVLYLLMKSNKFSKVMQSVLRTCRSIGAHF